MIVPSAAANPILIKEAESRNGLARVKNARPRSGDRIHILPCRRRNAAHALQQVEDYAFAGEYDARVVANHGYCLPIVQPNPIEDLRMADYFVVPYDRLVETAVNLKDAIHNSETGKNAVLFGVNRSRGSHARIDACLSCGVAGGTIFEEGSFENFSDAPAVPIQCAISGERMGA